MENQRVTITLPDEAQDLLDAISQMEGWVSRKQIAQAIGQTRLTVVQQKYLELLTDAGMIEGEQRKINSPIGYQWWYKAKGE